MNLISSFAKITIIKNGEELTHDMIPYFYNSIQRVFLSVKTSEVMKFEITLTPSYQDAIRILSSGLLGLSASKKSDKPDLAGTTVSAKSPSSGRTSTGTPSDKTTISGTGTGMTQVKIKLMRPGENMPSGSPYETTEFFGILYQPEVSLSGADALINLKGYGYSSLSIGPKLMVQVPEGEKTALDVIKETLEFMDYDPNPVFLDDSVQAKMSGKAPKRDANETLFNTLKWITGIVKCGFVENPQTDGSKPKMAFYDLSHSSFKAGKPKYTFVQWRQPNMEKNEFPMFDFKMDSSMLLFLQGQAFGTYKRSMLVDEKKEEESKQKDSQTDSLRNQTTQTKTDANSKKKPGQFISIPDDKSNEEHDKADAEFQEQTAKFQKFTLDVPGVPDVYIMDQINVRIGDVPALQTVCLVRSVSHTIDTSGWNCSLEVTATGGIDDNVKEKNEIKISAVAQRNENKLQARTI